LKGRFIVVPLFILLLASELHADRVILATTTSTYNTGLLDKLKPLFESKYDHKLDILAVGTGRALKYGMDGNADVLLVHAPPAEEKFMKEGHGVLRVTFMFNDFIVVAPPKLDIPKFNSVVELFRYIYRNRLTFISRGDDSGTHKKEKEIWRLAQLRPSGKWYWSTGQGMGRTLLVASEKGGITLTDKGTYLAYRRRLNLRIIHEGDDILRNPYSLIIVNPAKNDRINYVGALDFLRFMLDPDTLDLIRNFKRDDTPLFKILINPKR